MGFWKISKNRLAGIQGCQGMHMSNPGSGFPLELPSSEELSPANVCRVVVFWLLFGF